MLLSDSFYLYSQQEYSAMDFRDLQLIILAVFGAVDELFASCMFVPVLEIRFKWQLVYKLFW